MSVPTGQFSGLSIDSSSESASGSETAFLPRLRRGPGAQVIMSRESLAAIEATSGITYDLLSSVLDPEVEARAILGLTTNFEVSSCEPKESGYEFNFAERANVYLRTEPLENFSGAGNGAGPGCTCNCAMFRRRSDVACAHIFWLFDQLQGLASPGPHQSPLILLSDGPAQSLAPSAQYPSDLLARTTLEDVAERLNWPYIPSKEDTKTRTRRVRDILSAFSKDILPEEFRTDLARLPDKKDDGHPTHEESRTRTPEQCVVQGDFEATIFRLAVHDNNVLSSLCKAMPPGACAAIYFDKALERSKCVLVELDEYCRNLGTGRLEQSETISTRITTVLNTIRRNAENIHENILFRRPRGLQEAARTLILILEDICLRNVDVLASNIHARNSVLDESGTDEDTRNLYHQLIEGPEDEGAYFILDALDDIPPLYIFPFKERLRDVLHRVEVSRAPRGFVSKLGRIFRDAEANGGTGIIKKHGTTEEEERERESKRVRFGDSN